MPKARKRKKSGMFGLEQAVAAANGLTTDQYEKTKVTYTTTHQYTPDFQLKDGTFLEVKGWFSPQHRTTLLAVQKTGCVVRLAFQNGGKRLTKAPSSWTYMEWAERNGFEAVDLSKTDNKLPSHWLL